MTDGSPGRARIVPGGVSRVSGPSPTSSPPTIPGTRSQRFAVRLATTSAAPPATRTASTIRRRMNFVAGGRKPSSGPSRIIAGTTSEPATATSGTSPRNTHRQPTASETRSANTGPTIPGTTHAVDSTANMRGLASTENARPMAT
jgi:hypothetical protein